MDLECPHGSITYSDSPSTETTIESLKKKLLSSMGGHELVSVEVWRAASTEFIATTCLLFSLTTSIIACLEVPSPKAETKLLIPTAIFINAFLLLMVTIPLTGGHMNPIFSFIAALKGEITYVRALFYIIAQCLGSVVANFIMKRVMDANVVQRYSLGGCVIDANGAGISVTNALLIEFSCTFLVLYVAITIAFDKYDRYKELGLTTVCVVVAGVYALSVFLSIMMTGRTGYSGAGLNPARCLGSALLFGGPLLDWLWVFWVGPFLACIFYYLFTFTVSRESSLDFDF